MSGRPLRILVAANIAERRTGGMSRIMGFTHDVLAKAGHTVDYFYAEQASRYGVRGPWSRFSFPLALARFVADQKRQGAAYDVVNAHEPTALAVALRRRSLGNPRVVITSHGVERRAWELALEEGRLGRGGPTLKTRVVYPLTSLWQSALALRRADHVFCLSFEDRDYLRSWLGPACPSITRIFPAANAGFAEAAAARDYGRAERLLFAGTWRKNKGTQDLVQAFEALASRQPTITLTVLGGGFTASTILAAFPEALRPRVRCVSAESERETMAAFAAHDLFVLPSLFEGTPLTLVEAMASGLPIVTTATCGMKDVIRDGENGLLVPIRASGAIVASLERLIQDGELRQRLGRAARAEAAGKYTWERVAEPIGAAYWTLADAARRAGAP
jgi:glycosyltransferase involved in cell wall biosynthesis